MYAMAACVCGLVVVLVTLSAVAGAMAHALASSGLGL